MDLVFLLILLIISALYASVGHGGASGYLALMALYSFPSIVMRPSALLLNLFVAGIAFIQFYRAGHFTIKLFLPFAIGSVPLAFLGGTIVLDPTVYKIILGILLLVAVLRLLGIFGKSNENITDVKIWPALLIGAAIGFLSGLIGIGGGIILSPIILLFAWGNVKETAAVSALFIWINSLAGLIGMGKNGFEFSIDILPYIAMVVIGGFIGAYLGSFKWNLRILRYCLSFVLILASIKLIFI